MIELIGWIGNTLFALCAVPQAYHCYKNKSAEGVSSLFLALWFVGEILTAAYVYQKFGLDPQMHANYAANFLCLLVIARYKF